MKKAASAAFFMGFSPTLWGHKQCVFPSWQGAQRNRQDHGAAPLMIRLHPLKPGAWRAVPDAGLVEE
jgi:hypothetical protein